MYYMIDADTDEDGNIMGLEYTEDCPGRLWISGNPFLSEGVPIFRQPPTEPIRVQIKAGRENAPWPSYLHQPIPIMSTALLDVIRGVGVDNLDTYRVSLVYADGSPASDGYHAFNLIGKVAAADLEGSEFDEGQEDRLVAMSFDSLIVDDAKVKSLLMFRLAENVTTVLVSERIKTAVEAAGIPYVRFFRTEDIAIL